MAGTATATTCTGTSAARWQQPLLPPPFRRRQHQRQPVIVSFKNNNNKPNDMDRVLKEAWQNANDNFERFLFEAKKPLNASTVNIPFHSVYLLLLLPLLLELVKLIVIFKLELNIVILLPILPLTGLSIGCRLVNFWIVQLEKASRQFSSSGLHSLVGFSGS